MKKLFLIAIVLTCQYVQAQNNEAVRGAFSKSYSYESNKLYEKAIAEMTLVYESNSYEQNLRLGWLSYEAGKYNDAIMYYQNASTIHPNSIEARQGLVYPLSAQNKWEEVLKQYLIIVSLDRKNAKVNYLTGLIYFNKKNYTEAKKYFDTVLELYPFDYDSMLMAGWVQYYLGNLPEAKQYFEKVLLYSPKDKSAWEGMSLCK